jgi:sugar phosphate isomerase/epimerase
VTGSPIGLSTYAFFWQWSSRVDNPLSLSDMIRRTSELGVGVFQICDYPAVADLDNDELERLRAQAADAGVQLELGTRGVKPELLLRYLDIAQRLDVSMVRSMFNTADHQPTAAEALQLLPESVPKYEAAGVTLALETYEQVRTQVLVDTVTAIGSNNLGICLDPANCIAALETPASVIELAAPYVKNIHAKDFEFTRRPGWVGFELIGCPLGKGQLDYALLIEKVRPAERGISRIVEHWLTWQDDAATTVATENQWIDHNLNFLRSN